MASLTPVDIGLRIQKALENKGLEESDFLKLANERGMNISQSSFNKQKNGKQANINIKVLYAVSRITGKSLDWLLTGEKSKEESAADTRNFCQMLVNLLPSINIKISSDRPIDIEMNGFEMGFLKSFQRVKDESGKDVLSPVLYARISPALQEKGYKVNAHKAAIDICRFIKEMGELLDSDLTDKDKFIQYLVDRLAQVPIEKGASPDMVVGEIPQPEPQPPINPNDPPF